MNKTINLLRVGLVLSLLLLTLSCGNVESIITSNKSEITANDIIEKSVSNKLSVVTGLNQFDPLDERFKVNFRNISVSPVIVKDVVFEGKNKDIYKLIETNTSKCAKGDIIRPGGTCAIAIGAVSALTGLFEGDNLSVTFFSQVGGIGDFTIQIPVESFILKSDARFYIRSFIDGVSPYFYDFGRIAVGQVQTTTFKVFNESGRTQDIFFESSDSGFFRAMPSLLSTTQLVESGIPPCSSSIRNGEVCLIDITYIPSVEEKTQTAIISVSTEADGQGLVAPIQVTGSGGSKIGQLEVTKGNLESDKRYVIFVKETPIGSISESAENITVKNISESSIPISVKQLDPLSFIMTGSCITSSSISSGGSCTIAINFAPSQPRRYSDLFTISSGSDSIVIPVLASAGQPIAISGLKYSYSISSTEPTVFTAFDTIASVNFPDRAKVGVLAAKSVYIKIANTTTNKIFFTEDVSSANLRINGNIPAIGRCLSSVPASSSCIIRFDILPVKAGISNEIITLQATAGSFIFPLQLTTDEITTTISSGLTVDKFPVNFYDTEVGQSSKEKIVIKNTSSSPVSFAIDLKTDDENFSKTTTCEPSLAAGSSCVINIQFTPQAVQSYSTTTTVHGTVININGKGVTPYAVTTDTIIDGLQVDKFKFFIKPAEVDTVSKSVRVKLSATKNIKVKITQASGFNYEDDYSTCALAADSTITLSSGSSCNMAISFSPTTAGVFNSVLTITDNSDAKKSVKINLESESLPRNQVGIHGFTSRGILKTEKITFANRERFPIKLNTATINGFTVSSTGVQTALSDTTYQLANDTCSNKFINPNSSCTIDVKFTPALATTSYIAKVDVPVVSGTTYKFITAGSSANNTFVVINPESSYKPLGRPEQNMIAYNNKVYSIGGNHATHEENNALKVLNIQEMNWDKVVIDSSTYTSSPYAGYTPNASTPITLPTVIAENSASLRGAKLDVYDGSLVVAGGFFSDMPDVTVASPPVTNYSKAKINFISKIDLKTGKWSATVKNYNVYNDLGVITSVGTEIDRVWGDITRVGSEYYLTGGKPYGNGKNTKWDTARYIFYDLEKNNNAFYYSSSGTNYYAGMGVSTFRVGKALFLYQSRTNLGTGNMETAATNYTTANAVALLTSRLRCSTFLTWDTFLSGSSTARLSGSLPSGNRMMTTVMRNKTTKAYNLFLGTSFGSQSIFRISVVESKPDDPCTNYTATTSTITKPVVTPALPSAVFTYEGRLWVLSGNQILVYLTDAF